MTSGQFDDCVVFETNALRFLVQPREWNPMADQVAYTFHKSLLTS
jgi:hypothetical protein